MLGRKNRALVWHTDGGSPLYLSTPHVRCTEHLDGESTATERAKSISTTKGGWRRGEHGEWSYDYGRLRLTVRIEPRPQSDNSSADVLCHLSATALEPVRVERCTFELTSPCTSPPRVIDRFFRWRMVRGTTSINDYSPLIVRWGEGEGVARTEIRSCRGSTACELSWRGRELRLLIHVDAAALHPRWQFIDGNQISTSAPVWSPGQTISFSLALSTVSKGHEDDPPAVAARFPAGAEAAFVLTDHCDFDDAALLEKLLHGDGYASGWLGRGLKLTKGVFTLASTPSNRAPAASLQDARYLNLIQQLREDGSEIVPHALNESGSVSLDTYQTALRDFSSKWSPSTWIDHGTALDYCYTKGGASDERYCLLDRLAENKFSSLWAYHDVPSDPVSSLNLLASPVSDLRSVASHVMRHVWRGELLVALHYLRSIAHRHLRGPLNYVAVRIITELNILMTSWRSQGATRANLTRAWRGISRSLRVGVTSSQRLREPHTRRELLDMAAVVYPERAVPLHCVTDNELLLFTTSEVLHVRDVYTMEALERLVGERGLHLGHCYLQNRLPYIAGVFEPGANPPRLRHGWIHFVDSLTALVCAKRLWNPTVAGLVDWIRAMQLVTCIPAEESKVVITNPLHKKIRDFTLLLPPSISPRNVQWSGSTPGGYRAWEDWLAVWGDLPDNSSTVVQWD